MRAQDPSIVGLSSSLMRRDFVVAGGKRTMRFPHPFEGLSQSAQKRAFVPLAVLTLGILVGLQSLSGPLRTEVAPAGIVSFEFAGELSAAQSMVRSWGHKGQVYAGLNLGLDYLFLVAYAMAIGLGCVLVGRRLSESAGFVGLLGSILAWGQWGAAGLDGLENYALIQILLGSEQVLWSRVAWWCALPKFLIVALGLFYIVFGAILSIALVGKRHRAAV